MSRNTIQLWDSLYNLVSGLGTSKDPTTGSVWQLNLLSRNDVENAYRSDWVSRKIVDAVAEDATREWRQWQANQDQIQAIEAVEKTHDLQRKMKNALIRARLYGGAAMVFAIKDQDPAEELDLSTVGQDDLEFVVVMNRYELMAGPRIFNVDSPFYTRPEYYTVSTPLFGFYQGETGLQYAENSPKVAGTKQPNPSRTGDPNRQMTPASGMAKIHPSRVVEFVGNELPDWRLIPMGGGWGDSVLQTVDDVLKDIGLVVGGIANMVNDAKVDVIKIPDFSKQIATKEYATRLLSRFAYANQAKSTVNSILLDTSEEWERVQSNFGSVPNLLHEYMVLAAGASEIPISRFLGQAAGRGFGQGQSTGAGGQVSSEERAYYDRVASKQKNVYAPAMAPLDECIVRSALGKFDPNIDHDWKQLWQLDEKTKADIALAKANSTKLDVDMGLINEDALREARVNTLIEDQTYVGLEDAIDEYGIEPEEPDIQVPWSRLAGQLMTLGGGAAPNGGGANGNGANGGGLPQGGAGNGGSPRGQAFNPPEMRITRDAKAALKPNGSANGKANGHAKMRSVTIIRHGATKLNNDDVSVDRVRGWTDVPLSADGKTEANRLGKKMADNPPDHIYTSDLKRALDTAKVVAKHTGTKIDEVSQGFRPWNVGKYAGEKTSEALPVLADYAHDKPDEAVPDGESFNDFKGRFFSELYQALKDNPNKKVAIVTHHRNERLLHAWAEAGYPEDGSIDKDEFNKRGEATGSIDNIPIPMVQLRKAAGHQ